MWKPICFGNYFAKSDPICFSDYMSLDDKLELLDVWSIKSKAELLAELQLAEFIQNVKLSNIPSWSPLDTCVNWSRLPTIIGQSLGISATQTVKPLLVATSLLTSLDLQSYSMSNYVSSAGGRAKICLFSRNVITWTLEHSTTLLCLCWQGNGGMNFVPENPAMKLEDTAPTALCSRRHSSPNTTTFCWWNISYSQFLK